MKTVVIRLRALIFERQNWQRWQSKFVVIRLRALIFERQIADDLDNEIVVIRLRALIFERPETKITNHQTSCDSATSADL